MNVIYLNCTFQGLRGKAAADPHADTERRGADAAVAAHRGRRGADLRHQPRRALLPRAAADRHSEAVGPFQGRGRFFGISSVRCCDFIVTSF